MRRTMPNESVHLQLMGKTAMDKKSYLRPTPHGLTRAGNYLPIEKENERNGL